MGYTSEACATGGAVARNCPRCNGSRQYWVTTATPGQPALRDCPACGGTGVSTLDEAPPDPCTVCATPTAAYVVEVEDGQRVEVARCARCQRDPERED